MSDPFILDDEPFLMVVPSGAVIPVSNITAAEWTALKGRVTVVEAYKLSDLDDVSTAGAADTVLIKQADGTFAFGSAGGTLDRVSMNYGALTAVDDVSLLTVGSGLEVTNPATGRAHVAPVTGNTATTLAVGNHAHTTPSILRPTFGPTGYMSGGTRPLATQNVTLANGVTYLVKARLKPQMRGADAGAAYYTMTLDIGGNLRTSPGGASGFWCVQGVPKAEEWSHAHTITGTGAAVTVEGSVAFHSGAGFNVDAGELEIELCPNK